MPLPSDLADRPTPFNQPEAWPVGGLLVEQFLQQLQPLGLDWVTWSEAVIELDISELRDFATALRAANWDPASPIPEPCQ